jgi:hypothetical protein
MCADDEAGPTKRPKTDAHSRVFAQSMEIGDVKSVNTGIEGTWELVIARSVMEHVEKAPWRCVG